MPNVIAWSPPSAFLLCSRRKHGQLHGPEHQPFFPLHHLISAHSIAGEIDHNLPGIAKASFTGLFSSVTGKVTADCPGRLHPPNICPTPTDIGNLRAGIGTAKISSSNFSGMGFRTFLFVRCRYRTRFARLTSWPDCIRTGIRSAAGAQLPMRFNAAGTISCCRKIGLISRLPHCSKCYRTDHLRKDCRRVKNDVSTRFRQRRI